MNNKFITLMILGMFLLMVIPNASAYFTRSHIYWTVEGFQEVSGGVVAECEGRLDKVLDGNHFTDVMVIHYFDNEFMSYVGTHTAGSGVQECFNRAGSDQDLRCFCHGMALHNTQDNFAHNAEGLVPVYLEKYFAANLIGHMQIESDFEKKHMTLVDSLGKATTTDDIDYYDSILLNNFFEQEGGESKYLEIANGITGLDVRNDLNIFANGYKGSGFYDSVYNEKLKLPWFFWGISIGMLVGGILLSFVVIFFGRSGWKYVWALFFIIVAILGLLILLSFFTNNTWAWVKLSLTVLPIRVSSSAVSQYNDMAQVATNNYLTTGILQTDDNSGLSHRDSSGEWKEGSLHVAERNFTFILLPLLIFYLVLINMFFYYKSFYNGGKLDRIMNIFGSTLIFAGIIFFAGAWIYALLA